MLRRPSISNQLNLAHDSFWSYSHFSSFYSTFLLTCTILDKYTEKNLHPPGLDPKCISDFECNPSKTAVNSVALQRSSQMWRKWQVNITSFLNKLPTGIYFCFFFFFHFIEHVLLLHTYYFLWNLFILCILRVCLFFCVISFILYQQILYKHIFWQKKKAKKPSDIQSCEKRPYWIPWFSVSGHINK